MSKRIKEEERKKMNSQQIASREIDPNLADLHMRQGEIVSVLEKLRATRKMRGGVGAPLIVPAHLRDIANDDATGIVITDEDIK